jgi:Mce-associated membrane protein
LVPIILVVLLIAAGAFAGLATGVRILRADDPPTWQPFLDAGRQGALNLTTVSYDTVDADVKRLLDNATGTFHDDFAQRSGPFVEVVRQAKSSSKGTVTGAGLESLDGDTANVLVGITVKTTTPGQSAENSRAWRIRLTVARIADDYKISNVEFVA